jgi:hypothetical protein
LVEYVAIASKQLTSFVSCTNHSTRTTARSRKRLARRTANNAFNASVDVPTRIKSPNVCAVDLGFASKPRGVADVGLKGGAVVRIDFYTSPDIEPSSEKSKIQTAGS